MRKFLSCVGIAALLALPVESSAQAISTTPQLVSGSVTAGNVIVGGPGASQVQDSGVALGFGLISTQVAASSATLQWTNLGAFGSYTLSCNGLIPSSSGNSLVLRFSEDNGSTWKSASYNYAGMVTLDNSAVAIIPTVATGANAMVISGPQTSSVTTQSLQTTIKISNVASVALYKEITSIGTGSAPGPHYQIHSFGGAYIGDVNAVNGVEIFFGAGQIASGSCSLYGSVN